MKSKDWEHIKKRFKDFLMYETTLVTAIQTKDYGDYYTEDEKKLLNFFKKHLSQAYKQGQKDTLDQIEEAIRNETWKTSYIKGFIKFLTKLKKN